MNRLEQRYRAALRLLPTAYRRQWEDDMVAAFLASMHDDDPERAEYLADFGRPSWSEVASVAGLAARLHLGLIGAPSPRTEARSDMVRIVVLLWLLWGAVSAIVAAGLELWLQSGLRFLPAPPAEWSSAVAPAGLWSVGLRLSGLAWLVAFVAVLFGRPALTRTAAVVGVANSAFGVAGALVAELARNLPAVSVTMLATFAVDLALSAVLWTLAKRWPRVRPTGWLLALLLGTAVVTGLTVGGIAGAVPWWAVDPVTITAAAVVAVAIVRLVTGASPAWSLALTVLAWAMLVVRLLTLVDVAETYAWMGPVPMVFAVAEALALSVVAVPITVVAMRSHSRLPSSRLG